MAPASWKKLFVNLWPKSLCTTELQRTINDLKQMQDASYHIQSHLFNVIVLNVTAFPRNNYEKMLHILSRWMSTLLNMLDFTQSLESYNKRGSMQSAWDSTSQFMNISMNLTIEDNIHCARQIKRLLQRNKGPQIA